MEPYPRSEIIEEAIELVGVPASVFDALDRLTAEQRMSVFGAYCHVCGAQEVTVLCKHGRTDASQGLITPADLREALARSGQLRKPPP